MAAAGIGNPAGLVAIGDGENPRLVGGNARAEVISGGVFVFGSTATGVVSSGADSFASSDLLFARDASGLQFNGIAFQDTGSNAPIAIMTRGTALLQCVGSVFGGYPVGCDGNNAVSSEEYIGTGSPGVYSIAGKEIGRALSDGASGGYAVINIRG